MKKNIYKVALTLLASVIIFFANAQSFEIRTVESDYGYLTVQMRETSGTGTPTTATNIVDLVFVVRYPAGLVNTSLICVTNDYNIVDGLAVEQNFDGYDYHYWNAMSTPFHPPHDWTQNVWEDIISFDVSGATGSGLFEIAPIGWDGRSLNINTEGDDYTPTINGDVTYTYPTLVYDLVWTGSDATYPSYWDVANNWETTCGLAGSIPNTGNNCVIPVVSNGNYPINIDQVTGSGNHQPLCDYLRINSGASMSIDNLDEESTQALYTVNNDLAVYGTLNIAPDGQFTVTGDTYLDAAECLVVESTTDGTGSFIDNGTITYGASGTAKVQTWLTNSAGIGNFDMHFIGPAKSGATLADFILAGGSTYAYKWDETAALENGWVNMFTTTDPILPGEGIALSTTDNTSYTLEMTGLLNSGTFTNALTFSNNHYELIANPYPSSIDFDALATANSSVVADKYWIYDPAADNYVARAAGSGGEQYIQVGQGFFVETTAAGDFTFTNTQRSHSNDPFRNVVSNILTVNATGGQLGYKDEMIIRFADNATSGYDSDIEAIKWNSQNADATMIRSIAEDLTELAINVLPIEGILTGATTSVPVQFNCGYSTEYTLSFSDMETFETGSDIWLEDKQVGGDWVSINNNPNYYFTATPQDLEDRFVIHFFGTTSVPELDMQPTIDIYSFGQFAFVRNNTTEVIKNVQIYNIAGELVHNLINVNNKFNRLWVSDKIGYYVVRVFTEQNVYTDKVFINKY